VASRGVVLWSGVNIAIAAPESKGNRVGITLVTGSVVVRVIVVTAVLKGDAGWDTGLMVVTYGVVGILAGSPETRVKRKVDHTVPWTVRRPMPEKSKVIQGGSRNQVAKHNVASALMTGEQEK
jgi:hypothetical protein